MSLPLNIIPNLPPIEQELIEKLETPDGHRFQMHSSWHGFFSQLITALQNNFSNEGVTVPTQTTGNINLLANKNFALIGDNLTNELKVVLNNTVKTITTS